jgi:peptide/nickel transport system ATP-binding protein
MNQEIEQQEVVLDVQGLKTSFSTEGGEVRAVDDVSFQVRKGRTLGIVGESGCGKSVTSLSIMRLIPSPPGRITGGRILYRGRDILTISPEEMRKLRGDEISMIFQEPMTSLNPVFSIGNQICEAIELHQGLNASEARAKAIEMLKLVGIPAAEERIDEYPHQLSGGMRQRVMIAMALSCTPNVLIADEPTTALDVTIQAQILDLLRELQKKLGMAIILITHDLGVVAEMADDVAVMYAGRIVEQGAVRDIFKNPRHPYTRGLLNSIPTLAHDPTGKPRKKRLETIPGIVPNLLELPRGCRFQERCTSVGEDCRKDEPELRPVSATHRVRCIRELN